MPGKRKQFEETRAAVAAKLAQAREARQSAEIDQRQAEAALQDQEALLRRLEGQQFQVKDNTAYTALLNEMERAKEMISECETRILEGMDAAEAARAALAAAEAEDRATRERLDSEERAADAREETLQRELAELSAQRAQVGPKLDAKILAVYERVLTRRRPALALVSSEHVRRLPGRHSRPEQHRDHEGRAPHHLRQLPPHPAPPRDGVVGRRLLSWTP